MNDDICMIDKLYFFSVHAFFRAERTAYLEDKIKQLSLVVCKTHLNSLVIKKFLQYFHFRPLMLHCPNNRQIYQFHKVIHTDALSTDISTCKLWYAFFLLMKGDYTSTLSAVNEMLSTVAPFTLYFKLNDKDFSFTGTAEAKELYMDLFLNSRETTSHRAKRAWLTDFVIPISMFQAMPLAIQVELHFRNAKRYRSVTLSPFVCAYYLMFLCYHELHQNHERDRALHQLVDVSFDRAQCGGLQLYCLNIAGHCLYLAGKKMQARENFIWSLQFSQLNPSWENYNSAIHYLRHLF